MTSGHLARTTAREAADRLITRAAHLLARRHPDGDPLAVGLVFVAWDVEATRQSLGRLLGSLRQMSNTLSCVVVCNRAEPQLPWLDVPNVTWVVGTNVEREFSAMDHGIALLRERASPDIWVLANDRVHSYGFDHMRYVNARTLALVAHEPVLCGEVDRFSRPYEFGDHEIREWVRTNLLIASSPTLERLTPLTTVTHDRWAALLPIDFTPDWAQYGGPTASEYLLRLGAFIETTAPGRPGWYNARTIDETSWPFVRLKLLSIINEHVLSARARTIGIYPADLPAIAVAAALPPGSPRRQSAITGSRELRSLRRRIKLLVQGARSAVRISTG